MLPGTRSKNKNLNVTITHTCIILQILLNYVKSMNESDTFNNINSKYRCWTCLGTDDMIQSASIEETIWYQNNVKVFTYFFLLNLYELFNNRSEQQFKHKDY